MDADAEPPHKPGPEILKLSEFSMTMRALEQFSLQRQPLFSVASHSDARAPPLKTIS